jgi:aspartyl-tRNA(Asn)/glutamyl-tRNA(Gln) amidotransferase subunit A
MGSTTDNSTFKKTNNPWDTKLVAGGSSGGSAAAVAAGIVPFALGTDTGGSVRQPAAFCGIVGLKPTYGAVSRFGLVSLASSLDTAGILSDTISRCRTVFSVIKGKDPLDETSRDPPEAAPSLYPEAKNENQPKRIGVLSLDSSIEDEVCKAYKLAQKRLSDMGHTLVDIKIPGLQYAVPAYYTIVCAEASSNLARFDGIRYGKRTHEADNHIELVEKTRKEGFGQEAKLRILLGTFVQLSVNQEKFYLKALQIRKLIQTSFEDLLGKSDYKEQAKFDAILMPVYPTRAFGRDNSSLFTKKDSDIYTCCINLTGLPALSFPASVEGGLPVGVQLVGRAFAEVTLLDIAESYERLYPFPHPSGFQEFWKNV